jgi:hypothetical protein
MAYFKVLSVIKQYPELVVGNIYELDDYEAEVLAQGASGHILEHIMFVSDEFKASSCGLVSFGIKRPSPTVLINMTQEQTESDSNQSKADSKQVEDDKNTNTYDKEINKPEETNVVAEVINPFYYANEEPESPPIEVRYAERKKELNSLLVRDLKDLCDKMNITYKNKTEAIRAILRLEFPDYVESNKDQPPEEEGSSSES